MVYGVLFMVDGLWFMVYGLWFIVYDCKVWGVGFKLLWFRGWLRVWGELASGLNVQGSGFRGAQDHPPNETCCLNKEDFFEV